MSRQRPSNTTRRGDCELPYNGGMTYSTPPSKSFSASFPHRSGYLRLIGLWILRAFSPKLGRSRYFRRRAILEDDIGGFLGVPIDTEEPPPPSEVFSRLDAMLENLEGSRRPPVLSAVQRRNFTGLGELLGLNEVEVAVLQYLTCAQVEPVLQDTHRRIGKLYFANPARYLAIVLALPETAVRKTLGPNSRLRACGMIGNGDGDSGEMEFFSEDVAKDLLRRTCNPQKLVRQFGSMAPPPELVLDDFPQQQPDLDILLPHLRQAFTRAKQGVNVLLYGLPGTGKTQLTRVVGNVLGARVFEVAAEDGRGDPIDGPHRLNALRASQAIFRNTPTLLVFDEAEDVLVSASPFDRGAARSHKGWFNQLLENNRQPVLWVSNSIEDLDPAFARRFDMIIEIPVLPRAQREKVLRRQAGKLLTSRAVARLADSEHLAPAVVARSCAVVRGIADQLPADQRDVAVCRLIAGTLRAQGHPDPVTMTVPPVDPATYDLANLNTPADLPRIAAALHEHPSARICLYGPPGTGKTAFAHWLAADLGRAIEVRKASELLSPYVGVTEKNIARSFEQAAQEGAVLLIDEVDSFLQERSHAQRSWEVTQVNEMLTRIESYAGILLASTNLIDHLDTASLRRFDLKLHFDYLRPDQAQRLLAAHCRTLGLAAPTADELDAIARVEALTPGDFAAVTRRHRFQALQNVSELLGRLLEEIQHKLPRLRRIGFCQ